jgi:hypothetical protein
MLYYHKLPALSIEMLFHDGKGSMQWQGFLFKHFQCVNDVIILINCVS